MASSSFNQVLFRDILKRVSRSFYLTLAVLPQAVRSQIGLAYLLARAADTLADSGVLEDSVRLEILRQLKGAVSAAQSHDEVVQAVSKVVDYAKFPDEEQRLLEKIGQCLSLLEHLHPKDQECIAQVLAVLVSGMEFDIQTFPRTGANRIHALADKQALEFYTYSVAGCVGEFWTKMMCAHLPGFRRWDPTVMSPLGIRFGKGLQMVNILRDLSQDLQRGRCYMPRTLLQSAGLSPEDLLDEHNWEAIRAGYRSLLREARDHLDQGWRYTLTVPRTQVRVRLACMWPVLIGIQTLQRLSVAPNMLNPPSPIKISRPEVYHIVGATGLTGGCGYVGNAYWGYWRKRVV